MALTDASTRAAPTAYPSSLRWPTAGIDPARAWADDDPVADELLVSFDKPAGETSVAIHTPNRDDVYFLVDDDTETVVGVHVDDLRVWVATANPRWAILVDEAASTDERRSAIADPIDAAAGLFALRGVGSETG